jgi:selenophosphate synthase
MIMAAIGHWPRTCHEPLAGASAQCDVTGLGLSGEILEFAEK